VLGRLEGMKTDLTTVGGYDEIVVETPLEMAGGMLRSLGAPLDPLTIEGLETSIRDDDICGYSIWMLRMVTSCEIKRRADFFAPFIMGLSDLDVATFCARCVDPMGEESDHVQLVALTDALQVPVRVVYLDRSLAPGGGDSGDGNGEVHVDVHDFIPEGCPAPAKPRVHLLYRPGHYDLLYPLAS
jgi:ubiquitin thioesterase protein OTUB1